MYLKNPRLRQMEAECPGKLVGPMRSANFLKAFLGDDVLKQRCASGKFRFVEVKLAEKEHLDVKSAPFGCPSPHENTSVQGSDTRGQITTAQLAAQYRTHVFSVVVVDDGARLIRWDRAGAIFMRKFDYRENSYLAEFFWRYNRTTRVACGQNAFVTIADGVIMTARTVLCCSPSTTLHRFEVVDEVSGETTYYLEVAPHVKYNKSLTGRASRGIVIYDIKNQYLKHSWRVCTGYEIDKEGDTYRKLQAEGFRHVPTLVASGDVGEEKWHYTQTHIYAMRGDRPLGRMRSHRHYRHVLKGVGRDLTSFNTVGEVVGAIADAVQTHQDAYERAGILHRDINVGNILITDNGGGLLIDWDLTKPKSLLGVPRQTERTGT